MTNYSAHLEKKAAMPQNGDLVKAFGSFYTVCGYDGRGNIRMGNAYGVLTIWATRIAADGGMWTVK